MPIAGDTLDEPDETFVVNLSGATNATIADAQAIGTITDNDAAAINIGNVNVTEGNSGTINASFPVTLTRASSLTVTVNYATASGTAGAPDDYTTRTGTVTFAPGETTQNVLVPIVGDAVNEPAETFVVNLSRRCQRHHRGRPGDRHHPGQRHGRRCRSGTRRSPKGIAVRPT